MDTLIQDGRTRVVLDEDEYQDLLDARDHANAMRDVAAGAPTLTDAELDDYLAATTPLAFWRKRSGKTQAAIAEEVDISQPFLAQLEAGKRDGTVGVLARLARVLGVRIEDLVDE